MNKKIRFSLLTLLVMLCGTVFADYQKVTKTSDITDGEYLIVYEAENVAFNGALETLDAASNNIAVTIKEGVIASTDAIDAAVFTFNTTDKSIKSASGVYVGAGQSYSNGLKQSATLTDQFKHTSFAIDDEGNVIITKNISEGQNMILNYNSNKSDKRFRYYKEGSQKKIQLYKKTAAAPAAGYTVDFNNKIIVPTSNTASPVFQVSIGWTRIAPSAPGDGYGPYYMRYTYSADQGVDGTGALLANAQCAPQSTNDGTIETVNDYLVTPKVSGTVTLQVKGTSSASSTYPSFVKFYAIDDDATTVGDEITPTFSGDINNDDYVTATLTLTEATRLAIRAQWVYMDNFTATAADVPEVKSLTVASVMNMEGKEGTSGTTTYFEQQSDGTLSVPLKVLLSNTGNVDFVAGTTENYTLTLATASYASGTKTYYDDTKAIPVSLAAGASDTIEVTFSIPYTSSWLYYFVKENVSGTTSSSSRYAGTVAYEPKFVFRAAESTSTSSLSGAQAYGLIGEETTRNFEIANTGTAPLIIKSITLPEGFTSANKPEIPEGGLSIAKGAKQALDITLPITTMGSFSGNLTIVYLDKNAAEQTYTLAFSGNVLPAGTWSADFAGDGGIGYPAGSIAEGGINSDYQYSDGAYNYFIKGRTNSSYASENNKFITPKLHATAGQAMTFDVKGSYGSSYFAKVYVSTDRKTWGEPKAYFTYGETEGAVAIGSSEWVNKSITFDAEGDYYVAFSLYGEFKIDNIIGLTKVDVAHDLYIKSVNWPDVSVKSGTSLSKPSLDVIPLTDEAADAYTVKYVCGETVLAEGTPVELTTSANSSKTFSFSWTPTVESTTAYPATKVVFEFTDGTKIESESFDLTVTNEPIFHFVKTMPSSKWYEPSDYTTPITFGKTNTADAQTFYVYNWGSAPLTVKSISVPAGFTATPAEQFVVAAFDETDMKVAAKAVEITFSATEAGTYSGNMVITYVNGAGEDATFTLAVSGTKLDPTKFYANFGGESNQWPAGSVYQDNVSTTYIDANNYGITSTSTTKNIFVTPKLTAAAGEKLMFDAKLYSSYWNEGKVVVYAAATREEVLNTEEGTTRTQLFAVSGQDETNPMTSDFQTFEVTVPEAGDYFFGFEISNRPYVDEIYGLKAAAVAHDWTIASSNVPAEAMQNVAAAASVNILNLGLQDETADSYTATLYVNNEAVATAEGVAIPMSHKLSDAGTQLSFSFRYPKAGTFPVYIEVKAGDYSVKTEPVDVVFAEEVAKAEVTMAAGSTSNTNLLHMNWNNSESVSLYSKAVLAEMGLVEGSKISSITYKGYNTGAKDYSSTLNVWYEFTDDETQTSPSAGKYDTSAMTNVLSTTRSWTAKEGDADNLVDLITINFETPIVYTGKSLRLVVCSEATTYQSGTYFVQSTKNGSNASYYNRHDTQSTFENSQSWSSNSYLPAIYIGLAVETTTFSGTVKNAEGAAVANAAITLVSADGDNVQYSGKTDAEGAYSINVIQASRTYNVTVDAGEEYEVINAEIAFNGESKTRDFVLVKELAPEVKAALASLNEEIAKAEALKTEARTEGLTDFNAAIEAAKEFQTSVDAAAINAAIEALKAAEEAFLVANLPVKAGTYYVYNAYAKKFLSRGAAWGTQAVADDFGLPFNLTADVATESYKLQMVDNQAYYGDDYWMYGDCTGDRVRSYTAEKVEGGFYLHNTARNVADNRVYVYMKDDTDKWAIAGNAIVGDNVDNEAQAVWQFLTQAERDAIVAAREAGEKTAAFTAAGIAEDAEAELAEATELTFATGSAWTFTAKRSDSKAATNDNGSEVYQGTGDFTQTVENLAAGLYKVSIQAFYRDGANATVAANYDLGYNLSTAYLNANGTNIAVKSWGADRASDSNPNSMTDAKALFDAGKYLSEGYAYVGEDGKLNLTVAVPSFIGYGWFIAGNVKYAKVTPIIYPDAESTVAAPQFSLAHGTVLYEATTVTLTAEEGADIYYELGTNTLSSKSQKYTGPIDVTEDTAIRAFAVKDGKGSAVAVAVYTFGQTAANIAAFKDLEDSNPIAKLTLTDAVVTVANGKNIFVQDATGGILFYDTALELKKGDKLNGTIIAKLTWYKGMPELVKVDETNLTKVTITKDGVVTPTVVTIAEASDMAYAACMVTIKNVEVTKANNKFYATAGEESIQIYKQTGYGATFDMPEEGTKLESITGLLIPFNDIYEICPITNDDIVEDETTGINSLVAGGVKTIYNMNGQKMNKAKKGLNIINGKKVVVRSVK